MRWRVVPNYNSYIVSDSGIIVSNKTHRVLKQSNNRKGKGYLQVKLYNHNSHKQFYVHRLVAMVFLPKSNLSDIDHKDGNVKNNSVNNLEYVTHLENQQRAVKNGQYPTSNTSSEQKIKLTNIETLETVIFSSETKLSHWLGFNDNYISCKLRRKQNIINNKFKIERVEV